MKTIKEYIVDDKLNKYLLSDIELAIECMVRFLVPDSIYENRGRFENYDLVIRKIAERIMKEIDNSSLEECNGKNYDIDCSDCNSYCKNVNVTIEQDENSKDCGASFYKFDNNIIYLKLFLNPYWSLELITIEGAILHEMIHAYENNEKVLKGLPSIFDEFSEDYFKAKTHIHQEIDPVTAMVTLKYYLDSHERNAFFGALEKDIEQVIKDIDPKKYNLKISEVKERLQQLTSWKRYFEFNKFAHEIKTYSDKLLESAYYRAVKTSKEQQDDIKNDIKNKREGKASVKYAYVKSASEIKKEVKAKCLKFNKKFNQLFPKIFYEILTKN